MSETAMVNVTRDEFAGRRVVVTGGSTGIGAAIVRAFHAAGAVVRILDLDARGADRLAAELGGRVGAGAVDVRDRASV